MAVRWCRNEQEEVIDFFWCEFLPMIVEVIVGPAVDAMPLPMKFER